MWDGRRWLGPSAISITDGVIVAVDELAGDPSYELLVPGFVDIQVNGIDELDVTDASGADWAELDRRLLAQGVTTWCPTLITMAAHAYAAPLERIAAAMSRPSAVRPQIAGVHLEGPFLGGATGAHPRQHVVDVDLAWIDALPQHVALMTLGAEQPHATAAIERLTHRGVCVSIGHTLGSDAALDEAFAAGARSVTHLFNAMSGLHHRNPGVAAWALSHPSVNASIIADGVHVHPRMLALAVNILGPDRAILITDSVAWRSAGYRQLGIDLVDGAPRLPDGTLAGSVLTMDAAVRTCVAAGVPLGVALAAASTNPARLLALDDRGWIQRGCRADLVALGTELDVVETWVGGARLEG